VENLNYTKDDVKISPNEVLAVISSVNMTTSDAVYGTKAKKSGQKIIAIVCENADNKITHDENLNHYQQGEVPDNSKLGKFLIKYGGLKIGQIIKLVKNENGFWKVDF